MNCSNAVLGFTFEAYAGITPVCSGFCTSLQMLVWGLQMAFEGLRSSCWYRLVELFGLQAASCCVWMKLAAGHNSSTLLEGSSAHLIAANRVCLLLLQ